MAILTDPREERYAQERAKGATQIKAFTTAGFPPDDGHASRLNSKPEVKARIAELLERAAKRVEITQAMVLAELAKIGFSDIRKAVKWYSQTNVATVDADDFEGQEATEGLRFAVANQVELISSDDIDDETAAAISEVSMTDKGGLKVKFYDKRSALVDIGKHLGMFKEGLPEPTQVNVNIGDSELARLIVFQLQKAAKAGD